MLVELLIDGYNVIFQCGLMGTSTAADALEKSRTRLLNDIASSMTSHQRASTVVVFDAKDRPFKDAPIKLRYKQIRVLFAVDHEDADSMIEEIIRKHSVPKRLTVVSSDHRIQTAATRRKATAIDSDLWLEKIETTELLENEVEQPSTGPVDSIELTDEEMAELLDQFSKPAPTPPEIAPSIPATDSEAKKEPVDEEETDPLDGFDPFPPGYADDLF